MRMDELTLGKLCEVTGIPCYLNGTALQSASVNTHSWLVRNMVSLIQPTRRLTHLLLLFPSFYTPPHPRTK